MALSNLMKHLNGNILCSIDTETTGGTPGHHDIIQVAILPLDSMLKVDGTKLPFIMKLKPKWPENADPAAMDCNRQELCDLMLTGCDAYRAADLFVEWFENLKLGYQKRISPLACNWPFDRGMIEAWLGPETFNMCFDARFRDLQPVALFLNDLANWRDLPYPYAKINLSYLCTILKIERRRAHDAVDDARVTAEIYRRMIQEFYA